MSDDRRQKRLADLLERRADVYSPKRERNSYYGDDDIDLLRALLDEARIEQRRLRDALVSARWRLAKGRAMWNGPCHECDAALERGLTGVDIRGRASGVELAELDRERETKERV